MTGVAVQNAVEDREDEMPASAGEQFDLLGLRATATSRGLPQAQASEKRIGRPPGARIGRPPGARNKQTREWYEYLSHRYTHPLETLAAIQASGIDELAARLGCTKLEALQEKRIAAAMLLPYMAKKMPVAVQVNGKILHLNILSEGEVLPVDDSIELAPEPAEQTK